MVLNIEQSFRGMEISIGLESSEKILILRMHLSLNFNAKILAAAAQLWKLDVLAGVAAELALAAASPRWAAFESIKYGLQFCSNDLPWDLWWLVSVFSCFLFSLSLQEDYGEARVVDDYTTIFRTST